MKSLLPFFIFILLSTISFAQIQLEDWKFQTGDDPNWAKADVDDSKWKTIKGNTIYENQGYDYNGYSWYRVRFELPKSLREQSFLQDSLRIIAAKVDDIDATYLNGVKIGGIGIFPEEPGGPVGYYDQLRRYTLAWNHPAIKWDEENVIAIRVYDGGGGGGLWGLTPSVDMIDLIDFVSLNIDVSGFEFSKTGRIQKVVQVKNTYSTPIEGTLRINVQPKGNGAPFEDSVPVKVAPLQESSYTFSFPYVENATVAYTFSEKHTNKQRTATQITPYILTPPEGPAPKITNALVYGARPNHPFLWSITATGSRPMIFKAQGLPKGLELNSKTGIIKGNINKAGDYPITLMAQNSEGAVSKNVTIKVGKDIALTPPLGWNSWNCWGMAVSDNRVRQSAEALITSGLVNHGWTYINIDDGWQGERTSNGQLNPNEKFPDMKSLGDYLHSLGLKFGIYSSPGPETCGGLAGSMDHEKKDVETWASWGIDYIKYDWCSYSQYLMDKGKEPASWTEADYISPFRKLSDAIVELDRDMIFSVANWGQGNAWEWGDKTGGQLWRTTGDIEDSWVSLESIGFTQETPAAYSHPGGWSDPDMLIVGWVGWGDKLHQTRLTPSEQYTHISLWALLSAPLLIGCDLNRLDAFTYNLLANDEVIAINQDYLGNGATIVQDQDNITIWVKELYDGSRAVGIFNRSDEERKVTIDWSTLDLASYANRRDVWRQQEVDATSNTNAFTLDNHGVQLLKFSN